MLGTHRGGGRGRCEGLDAPRVRRRRRDRSVRRRRPRPRAAPAGQAVSRVQSARRGRCGAGRGGSRRCRCGARGVHAAGDALAVLSDEPPPGAPGAQRRRLTALRRCAPRLRDTRELRARALRAERGRGPSRADGAAPRPPPLVPAAGLSVAPTPARLLLTSGLLSRFWGKHRSSSSGEL